jgi:hypothetical protein
MHFATRLGRPLRGEQPRPVAPLERAELGGAPGLTSGEKEREARIRLGGRYFE